MNKETKMEIVRNAVRWCTNILAEVLSNYGKDMEDWRRDELKKAVCALGNYQAAHAPIDTEEDWECMYDVLHRKRARLFEYCDRLETALKNTVERWRKMRNERDYWQRKTNA